MVGKREMLRIVEEDDLNIGEKMSLEPCRITEGNSGYGYCEFCERETYHDIVRIKRGRRVVGHIIYCTCCGDYERE